MKAGLVWMAFFVFLSADVTFASWNCSHHAVGAKYFYYSQRMPCYKTNASGIPPVPSLEGQDPLLQDDHSSRTQKKDKCAQAAYGRGFKYFALFDGGKCLSSADPLEVFMMYGERRNTYQRCYRYSYYYSRCYSVETYCLDGYGSSTEMNVFYLYRSYGLYLWLNFAPNVGSYKDLFNQKSPAFANLSSEISSEVKRVIEVNKICGIHGGTLEYLTPSSLSSMATAHVYMDTTFEDIKAIDAVLKDRVLSRFMVVAVQQYSGSYCNHAFNQVKLSLSKDVANPTKVPRGYNTTFKPSVYHYCGTVQNASYRWDIFQLSQEGGGLTNGTLFSTASTCTICARSLDFGSRYLQLTMTTPFNENSIAFDYGFLEIVPTPLSVHIKGGARRVVIEGDLLTFDGSETYDADVFAEPGNYTGMNFTWVCAGAHEHVDLNAFASLPEIHPTDDPGAFSDCFGQSPGRFRTTNLTYSFNSSKLTRGRTYAVTLIVQKGKRLNTFTQILNIAEGPPAFLISCTTNCAVAADSEARIGFVTTCIGPNCLRSLDYHWDLEINKGGGTWEPIAGLSGWTLPQGSRTLPELLLAEGLLQPRTHYRVSFRVTTQESAVGTTYAEFRTNDPPRYGSCAFNSSVGKALVDDFFLTCEGWIDEDTPLTYELQVARDADMVPVMLWRGLNSTARLKLPIGKREANYTVTVFALIFDSLGGNTKVNWTVSVLPPDIANANAFLMDLVEGDLQKATQNADYGTATQLSLSVLTLINEGGVNGASLDEAQIKEGVVGGMSTFGANDTREINQLTGVLLEATNKPEHVTLTSQTLSMDAAGNMTAFLMLESGSRDDKTATESAGTQLFGLTGNVLGAVLQSTTHHSTADKNHTMAIGIAQKALNTSYNLGDMMLKQMFVGEAPKFFHSHSLTMKVARQPPGNFSSSPIDIKNGSFKLPSDMPQGSWLHLDTKVRYFPRSPFFWEKRNRSTATMSVNTPIISLDLSSNQEENIEVSDLPSDIEILIPNKPPDKPKGNTIYAASQGNSTSTFRKFHISHNYSAGLIRVEPVNESILEVFVKYGQRPNATHHDFRFLSPNFSSCLPPEDLNCSLAAEFLQCLGIDEHKMQTVESYMDPTSCPPEALTPPGGAEENEDDTMSAAFYPCPPSKCSHQNISYYDCSCTMIPHVSFLWNETVSNDVEACQSFAKFVTCAESSVDCALAECPRNACTNGTCQSAGIQPCKDEVNFLSCYPGVTYDRLKTCQAILHPRPELLYRKYGECKRDPFASFFPAEYGRVGDVFISVRVYEPEEPKEPFPDWNETDADALLHYRELLLQNASLAEGYRVSWGECEINNVSCADLLTAYRRKREYWDEERGKGYRKIKDGREKGDNGNEDDDRSRRRRREVPTEPDGSGSTQKRCTVVEEKPPPEKKDDNELPTDSVIVDSSNASLYSLDVYTFSCQYWDDVQEEWSTFGCKPGPYSSPESIQCLCNHLTSFGGGFLVTPNTINFNEALDGFANLSSTGNVAVVAAIATILLLYMLGVVLARRADRHDTLRAPGPIQIRTEAGGSHKYEITIYTGMFGNSGTTANVAMVMCGDAGESDVLPLVDTMERKSDLFARASVNTFEVKLHKSLGILSYIRLWHDNVGPSPGWFVRQVVIRDVRTNEKSVFVCNRWLAVDKSDTRIERMFFVSSQKALSGFRNLFYSRAARGLGDGHLWVSVYTRPPNSPFTRVQRLTCCLALLLSAMLANAMFYQVDVQQRSMEVVFGPVKFNWREVLIGVQSSLVVVPVNVLIIQIFRNVGPQNKKRSTQYIPGKSGEGRTKRKLPHWTLYIAYTLAFGSVVASAFLTMSYSMVWGKEKSNQWLMSVLISLFQDILLFQPLKVLLAAILLAFIVRKPPEEDPSPAEHDEADHHAKDAGAATRDRNTISSVLYSPLDQSSVEAAAEKELKARILRRVVADICLQLLFVLLLTLASYGTRNSNRFLLSKHVLEIFPKTEKIHDERTFWYWTETIMLPGLFDNTWYNGDTFDARKNLISDRTLFLISLPRLRQSRVRPESCDAWTSFPKLKAWFPRCYGGYTAETAEQSPLVENATRSTVSIRTEETWKEGMCEEPFIFKDSQELGTLPVVTALTTYMGGGLVADLGYNITMAREVISNLQQDKWISRQTRAIFLEIVLFEPATNTFAFVRFTFEYMTTGKIIAYRKVEPLSFYGSGNPTYDTLIYVFYVLLVLLVAFSFYREVMDLRRRRCEYFKDPWSYMEMVLNAATLALIVVFLFKAEYSRRIVQKIQCNPYSRMSFDYVVLWTDVESVLLALVIFLATLKLLRIVRFNEHVSILAWTMRFSRGPLASYAAIFLTQVTAFAILGNLLFGSTKFMYSTMVRTLVNCFEMILGKGVDFAQLEGSYPLIGPLYLFGYNFFVTILVMNFFIAILCDSFAEAQQKSQEGNEDVEVADMMLSQIKKSMKEISGNLRSLVTTSENNHSLKSTYNERDYFLY